MGRCGEEYVAPSPAELRECFVDLCVRGETAGAAPLLGDVVLLSAMTNDFRRAGLEEAAVRAALVSDLEERLEHRGYAPRENTGWREWAYYFDFPVRA